VGRGVDREARSEFTNQADLAAGVIERRMQRNIDLLFGLDALASHDPKFTRQDFVDYVTALDVERRFPGIKAIQFVRRQTDPERWVIQITEPMAGNESAVGFDIRTRPAPLAAAQRARDTGDPTMTGRYRLVQEPGRSFGLVIYLPVYNGTRPRTPAERAEALRGFVNVVLRVDDLFTDILHEPLFETLRLDLHDLGMVGRPSAEESAETLFYRSEVRTRDTAWYQWAPVHEREIGVAGRNWKLKFESDPLWTPWLRPVSLLTLGAGLMVSLLLFGIFRAVAHGRHEALELAKRATRDLRTQLSFTQELLEAIPNPVFFKDAEGRYIGCNRAFEEYIGFTRENLVGKTVYDISPRDLADRYHQADKALLDIPGTQSYEASVVYAKDGTRHDVLFSKATFFDLTGAVAGLVGVIVDITQRKQLEANTRESNERLRAVIHAAPVAIIARDFDSVIRMWNPAAERMFGWREEEVLNTNTSIDPEHLVEETRGHRERAQRGEAIWIEETLRMHRDGHLLDCSMSLTPVFDADGRVSATMVTITDITARKAAERALRESEERLRLAMDAAQMGMWYWEVDSDNFTYSEGLSVLFGRRANDPAIDYRALQERLHPDDRELFAITMRHAVKQGVDFQVDYRVVWPDGSTHWLANRGQVHRNAEGRAVRVIGVALDITDRKQAEQRIAHMAHHDALTGLPNRVLLRDRIGQAIAQAHRNGTQLAVLFIDLDRFKTINDSLGHQLGDRLLQSVASRVLVCVREGDTVSRVGGDEFVIVIPGLHSAADAAAVATKILEVLASAFHLNGVDLHVAASVGISLYPADGADAETLMRNADTAMYHAKDSGRGNYQFFTQHMNVAAQQRLTLENALRRGLENREFELHYQPLYDLRDRTISGFEALVRWNPPGREMVSPAKFIPTAEESGLIVPLGEWVLREALKQAKTWHLAGRPLMVSVNVSAKQLARSNFVERLRRLIQEFGIDPANLELEVTESVIIEGAGDARKALDQIAALGVGIAIDDFGTGYSGLAYLKRLPIDTVKIDQSFVRDLTVDPDDAAIVTAIVAMAKSLGVDTVAEGVETEEQLAQLTALGCHRAQGYLLAKPMNAAAVNRLLARAAATAVAD
jgi:diguanylate cyclase (GGDEF)-like protein/PAS domain S-box-containing protein